jgi:hypothetical protein
MRTFKNNQRVYVKEDHNGVPVNAEGDVVRIRTDGGAFVALDKRHDNAAVHPFPADDDRGCHVRTYPDLCELPASNAKQKRAKKRAETQPNVVTRAMFGQDHWRLLGYLETLATEHGGIIVPVRDRMRCDADRHPFLVGQGQRALLSSFVTTNKHPTCLRNGKLLHDHDDWDCCEDLVREGLLLAVGTGANPEYRLTSEGQRVAALLRVHLQTALHYGTFSPLRIGPATAEPGGYEETVLRIRKMCSR